MRLWLCLAPLPLLLLTSCARQEIQASTVPELPVVAVAKVSTEDLSRGVVLTAEFRPFQEVDVMSKVAGYIKDTEVDVPNPGGELIPGMYAEVDLTLARQKAVLAIDLGDHLLCGVNAKTGYRGQPQYRLLVLV